MSIEAMQQALNALEYHTMQTRPIHHTDKAIEALRQAIEQAEKQEPVAWMVLTQDDKKLMLYGEEKPPIFNTPVKLIPLYAAPPKSDNELDAIDKSIHEEMERLKTEIKRLKELAEYRLKLLMKMPEQAEKQEPVAYIDHVSGKPKFIDGYVVQTDYDIPLCTAPPRKEWVGLTDAELAEFSNMKLGAYDLCLEVEAKLMEKNT
jgi:hypothetical protein